MDAFHKNIQCSLEKLGKSNFGFERTTASNVKSKRHKGSGNELVDYSRAPCLGADQKSTWALGTRLRFRGKNGGVLSMRMQAILDSLDSLFVCPGSAPTGWREERRFQGLDSASTRPRVFIISLFNAMGRIRPHASARTKEEMLYFLPASSLLTSAGRLITVLGLLNQEGEI